jgi:hypothetical protein
MDTHQQAAPRARDHDAIVRMVQLYVDGFNDNDIAKFKQAFHEDAWIFYVDADGKLTKNLLSENFAHWAAPPSWSVVGRIISVTQVGRRRFGADHLGPNLCSIWRMDRLP